MKRPNAIKRTLLIVILMAALAIVGVLTGVIGWVSTGRGDFCVQCGARRHAASFAITFFSSSIPLTSSSKTNDVTLTSLWEKYCGGCYHDWTPDYVNTRGPLQGAMGDWFPSFDYPVGQNPEGLSTAIELLQTPVERAVALRTIGNRDNLLRFVAAGALYELGEAEEEERRVFQPDKWWAANSDLFIIETNIVAAEAFLRQLQSRQENWVDFAVDRSREMIRRTESHQQRQPAKNRRD